MKRLFLLLCLASSLVFAECQEGVGTPTLPRIQGYLKGAEEAPLAGVKVELVRLKPDGSEDGVVDTRTTDKEGRFRFKRAKNQDYHVRIHSSGPKRAPVRVRQGSVAMLPGGGLMNFVFFVDNTECIGISLTE